MVINEGYLDRSARIIVGIQMMALGLSGAIGGSWGVALILTGAVLIVSGTSGRCLVYRWLGWTTVPRRRAGDQPAPSTARP